MTKTDDQALTVERRHRDAAADLIGNYWPNSPQMQQLAQSIRGGAAACDIFSQAFAKFERDHLAALSAGREGDYKAAREAIVLIDELNERKKSRAFWGIGQTLHAKLCTIRATLAIANPATPKPATPSGDLAKALRWAEEAVEYKFGGWSLTGKREMNAEHVATLLFALSTHSAGAVERDRYDDSGHWHPQVGERVEIADHCDDASDWNRSALFVAGVTAERGKEGVNVSVCEEWPVTTRSNGFTDGFWINRPFKRDDVLPVRALATQGQRGEGE